MILEGGALMSEISSVRGRCLCGGIRYSVHGELRDVTDCHCERCRRFTGHHMAATSALVDEIDTDDADSLLRWFWPVPEAGYAFCSRCGSSLFWESTADPERRSICAGSLDAPTGLTTARALWTSQASDYYTRPEVPESATE
jgi:hypothetical protein